MAVALSATVYLLVGVGTRGDASRLLLSETVLAGGASVFGHVTLFALTSGTLVAIQALAARRAWHVRLVSVCLGGIVAALASLIIFRSVLVTLTFGRSCAIAAEVIRSCSSAPSSSQRKTVDRRKPHQSNSIQTD